MPNDAADHAVLWTPPLLIVLQETTCGVLPSDHCDTTTPGSCIGGPCKLDSDCYSTLICEKDDEQYHGTCQHQPDIIFFNVTAVHPEIIAIDEKNETTKSVAFSGLALGSDSLSSVVQNEMFEFISIAPADKVSSSEHMLDRRHDFHCDTHKWFHVPVGFYCNIGIEKHVDFKVYLMGGITGENHLGFVQVWWMAILKIVYMIC